MRPSAIMKVFSRWFGPRSQLDQILLDQMMEEQINRVYTATRLLDEAWNRYQFAEPDNVDVAIMDLRTAEDRLSTELKRTSALYKHYLSVKGR